jgi:hypothetical protein
MIVASLNKTAVRYRRFSHLLLAARRGPTEPAHTWAVSNGSSSLSGSGVPCSRLSQYPWWLADESVAGRRSNPQPGSRIRWAGYLSPTPPSPAWPVACFWDDSSGTGPGSSGPPPWSPLVSTAWSRSRRLLGSLPTAGRWRWGVPPGPARVTPEREGLYAPMESGSPSASHLMQFPPLSIGRTSSSHSVFPSTR